MSVCLAAGAELAVTASHDTTLHVFDVKTFRKLALLRGHGDAVLQCAASVDGRFVVSVSKDKTVKLWDLLRVSGTATTNSTAPASGDADTHTADTAAAAAAAAVPVLLRRHSASTVEGGKPRIYRGEVLWSFAGHNCAVRACALDPVRTSARAGKERCERRCSVGWRFCPFFQCCQCSSVVPCVLYFQLSRFVLGLRLCPPFFNVVMCCLYYL